MKVLVSEKLSEHKYKTPEGYLICTDAILARTGKQSYTKDELFQDGDNTEVNVDRPYDEVMNAKTIASFENKPVTFDHPDEEVNVGNYKDYAIGYVRDVHQGKTDKDEDVILGNLVITDQEAINAIEQGDHTDLSCGYDCDIKDDGNGNYSQTNIRGNHLALCEQGRAGIAHIVDSKVKDDETIDYKGIKIGVLHTSIGTLYEVRYNKNKADWPEYKKLENAKKYIDIFLTKGEQAANASWKIDDTIVDSKIKDSKIEGVPPELLLSASEWLEDKVYIERKYHVKIYNITSNKGLTVTGSRQDLEKLYKDYHLRDYNVKIVDNEIEDMAVWQLKPETNLDKLSVAITNENIDTLKAMLSIVNKDIDDYNKNYDKLSNSDKLMLKKKFGKLVEKMNQLGVRTHTLRLDSKEMTMSDAIKMLNIVDAYKKVKDASKDEWVIKNTGLAYEIWNRGKMVKKFPTKKLAIEWIHSRFPTDEITEDSTKDGRLWSTLTRKAKHR